MTKRNIILSAVGAAFLMLVSGIAGYALHAVFYPGQSIAPEPTVAEENGLVTSEVVAENAGELAAVEESEIEPEPKIIKEEPPQGPKEVSLPERLVEEIEWIKPEPMSDLFFFRGTLDATDAIYHKIGLFSDEELGNGTVILASTHPEGPSFRNDFSRFVVYGDQVVLVDKNSDHSDHIYYTNESPFSDKVVMDKNFVLPALDFPNEIAGPKPDQVLTRDENAREFFDETNLKKVFTYQGLGDVYTDDVLGEGKRHGFYLRAPDGTLATYYLKIDFMGEDNVPAVTWDDGAKNEQSYSQTTPGGCGPRDYIAVYANAFTEVENQLKLAGVNSLGDAIYVLKNENDLLVYDLYNNSGIQEQPPLRKDMTYAEFLAKRPFFFWVDPFGRVIKFSSHEFIPPGECAKPVIYLYPEKTTNVSVRLKLMGGLTYSEPDYGQGWQVQAQPDGTLTELKTGQEYPYLFWEGRGGIYQGPTKGFVAKREEVHEFLVKKLAQLGLNEKETADFIEFWEPKMREAPYYFVSFLGTRAMEQIAPLTIEPKPDTVIRILMDFTPLEQPIEVEGYDIKTPVRKGFTVVEWGGVLR